MKTIKKVLENGTVAMLLSAAMCLSFGQKVEFVKSYKYTASNDDSRNSAKTKAMEEAQAALLREIGVLVEGRQKMTTNVSGNNTKEDFVEELKTYTVGKVQTTIVAGTEEFIENDKGYMVYLATFKMVVDTADLYKYLDNIVKQKEQSRLAETQKEQKIQRIKKEIEDLKKQLEIAKTKENELLNPVNAAEKRLAELKTQRDEAQQDYKSTLNARNADEPAGIAKTKNAMNYLNETQNLYNAQEAECKKLEKALMDAENSVNKAQEDLYNAEVSLANEIGTPPPTKPNNVSAYSKKKQEQEKQQTQKKKPMTDMEYYSEVQRIQMEHQTGKLTAPQYQAELQRLATEYQKEQERLQKEMYDIQIKYQTGKLTYPQYIEELQRLKSGY